MSGPNPSVSSNPVLLDPPPGLTEGRQRIRDSVEKWEAERKQKRDATLNSVRLWIKRHLESLHARSNSTGPGLKANGYAVAEIPDWELRQMLESVEEELGLKPAQETNATEARESSSPPVC